MKRELIDSLIQWKRKPNRSPLVLKGARQVGKTYLVKEFGCEHFNRSHYFNFEKNRSLALVFEQDLDPVRIVRDLSLIAKIQIDPFADLIIFDEIQACPKALTALKYFNEDLSNCYICCAGSHMGMIFMEGSFPVGQVELLTLYPMSFSEYLLARNQPCYDAYLSALASQFISPVLHKLLLDIYKEYLFVGGMPQAISLFLEKESYDDVRHYQQNILEQYNSDIVKYAGKVNALHIRAVFEAIPRQLSQVDTMNTKRFTFKDVLAGKTRFQQFESPISWLLNSFLAIENAVISSVDGNLLAHTKTNLFKLFFFDVGLLGASLDLSAHQIMLENYGFTKGYYVENFIAQELVAKGVANLVSWQKGESEIEFILKDQQGRIIPLEVKSGTRLKAKSLTNYIAQHSPAFAIKTSANPLLIRHDTVVRNIPLYLVADYWRCTARVSS